ncbi:hypothetical protein A2U01_0105033, partial [Trifolium medium]|nr:hypothetical protein [Trifolium medium]
PCALINLGCYKVSNNVACKEITAQQVEQWPGKG